jgi:hypothetical protein
MDEKIRASLEWILQQLIEAEATSVIEAGRHERSEGRMTQRTGWRPRLLSTPRRRRRVGDSPYADLSHLRRRNPFADLWMSQPRPLDSVVIKCVLCRIA